MLQERDSHIFRELNSKTLGDKPAEVIDRVTRDVHIETENIPELLEIDLINKVTFRDGLPIPGTGKIVSVTASDSDETTVIFTPSAGEVWLLGAAEYTTNNSNTRGKLQIYNSDGAVEIGDESGHGDSVPFDPKANYSPVYLDENVVLRCEFTGLAAAREAGVTVYLNRVR